MTREQRMALVEWDNPEIPIATQGLVNWLPWSLFMISGRDRVRALLTASRTKDISSVRSISQLTICIIWIHYILALTHQGDRAMLESNPST